MGVMKAAEWCSECHQDRKNTRIFRFRVCCPVCIKKIKAWRDKPKPRDIEYRRQLRLHMGLHN